MADEKHTVTPEEEKLAMIKSRRRDVVKAQAVVDKLKAELKTANGALERAIKEVWEEVDDDQLILPFGSECVGWRDERVETLIKYGLTEGDCEKLKAGGIDTLGALATYSQTSMLTDIAGIGEATVSKIEDASTAYWADNFHKAEDPDEQSDDGESK